MKIVITNEQKALMIDLKQIKRLVHVFLSEEKCHTHEVSIHFVTSRTIIRLHREYFSDPTPTDCISFPIDGTQSAAYHVLGEIFVCPQAAITYVGSKKREKVMPELFLYVIHGLLHLVGYDDIRPKQRKIMKQREREILVKAMEKKVFPFYRLP